MIITIGRQHGSNGHDIAIALAYRLGCACYDKEIVEHAAEASGFSRDVMDSFDERRVPPYIVPGSHYSGFNQGMQLNMRLTAAQFDAIRSLADKGDCIFVGRCADYILRDRSDIVRVFVMADADFRIKTMMERRGLTQEQAKKLVKEVDKDRASYYKYYTDQIWGESGNYDICVDSGRIGVDGAVSVIASYISALKKKTGQ